MKENTIDWKEIGITFGVCFVAATAAVALITLVVSPALAKTKENAEAKKAAPGK